MVGYRVTGIRQGNPILSPRGGKKLREIMDQWLEVYCLEEATEFIDNHTKYRIRKEVLGNAKG